MCNILLIPIKLRATPRYRTPNRQSPGNANYENMKGIPAYSPLVKV